MAVIDCFPFNGEYKMLEARINELRGIVNYHVLVEATQTFVGDWKAPSYNQAIENRHSLVLPYVVTFPPHLNKPWERERYQRDVCKGILDEICRPTDQVILSDLDEIPRSSAWGEIDWRSRQEGPVRLETEAYVHSLQLKSPYPDPSRARVLVWKDKDWGGTLSRIRFGMFPTAANACWHFTWFGDKAEQQRKLESFSHTELDTAWFREKLAERDHDNLDTRSPLATLHTDPGMYESYRLIHAEDPFPVHIIRALDPRFNG